MKTQIIAALGRLTLGNEPLNRNQRSPRFCGITVSGVRRSVLFKPLAILLVILMAPAVSRFQRFGNSGSARPFQALAQAVGVPVGQIGSCTPGGNRIIQNYCDTKGNLYNTDLTQLENESVLAYLGLRGLPQSDANIIYDYGRSDLRSGVRATMLTTLMGIIQKPAGDRTPHERGLYAWFEDIVWTNEIKMYQTAVNHFQSFKSNPCLFSLDADIAKALKLSYDGTPFCYAIAASAIFGVPVPSVDYFTAYGLKNSYGSKATENPNFALLVTQTALSTGATAGIAIAGAGVISAAAGGAVFASTSAAVAAFTAGLAATPAVTAGGAAAGSITTFVSGASISAGLGVGAITAGTVGIIFTAVAIGIIAGIQVFKDDAALAQLNNLSSTLAQTLISPPNLKAFIDDTTGIGLYKLNTSLVSSTVSEVASTATLPVHRPGTDVSFEVTPSPSGPTTITDTLTYQDWKANVWTAKSWGGWFVQTCADGASSTCGQKDSIGDIQYVDSSGTQWMASRFGANFVHTKGKPAGTDKKCVADPLTGVSPGTDFSQCFSYVSSSLRLKNGAGNPVTVVVSVREAPSFIVSEALSFSPGTPSTRVIKAVGKPTPTVCWNNGLVHQGFTWDGSLCESGSFHLNFDGGLSVPTGQFTLQLSAESSSGLVRQNFTVTVSPQLNIITPSTISGIAGFPMTFTVVATGNPTPKLTLNQGALDLGGLTFKDNGNGTATISGTYLGLPATQTCIPGCEIVASNSQGSFAQRISLAMAPAPAAKLAEPTSAVFQAGVPNTLFLTSYGAITPVSWFIIPDPSAPWLTLHDNHDGTATLSGTPPPQATGAFSPFLGPGAVGTIALLPKFPLTVTNGPIFTSPNSATFTVGTPGSFGVVTTSGIISTTNTAPPGLFFAGGNPASLAGTPAVGSGGQYSMTFEGNGSLGSTQQAFNLNVNEGPSFTSPRIVTLFAGVPASFDVTTVGYPRTSNRSMVGNTQPPTSPSQGNGMFFTVSGLPASFSSSNLTGQGLATGTLTISGTPQASDVGSRTVQIRALNGVGAVAQQALTLQVFPFNSAAPVNLISNFALSRDPNNNVVATVVVANAGGVAAQNVAVTSARIGMVAGTVTPPSVPAIPSASSATFTITFPGSSLGAAGSANVLNLSGTYTGGTFNNAGRIVLP